MPEPAGPAPTGAIRGHPAGPAPGMGPADRTPLRLVAFAVGLIVALAAGFGLGRVVTPGEGGNGGNAMGGMNSGAGAAAPGDPHAGAEAGGHSGSAGDQSGTSAAAAGDQVGGLAVSAGGYTLVPEATSLGAGPARPFRFRINGPDGQPVTTFATNHEQAMHFIVVRRDLSGYQHLHPTMAADGTWSVPLALGAPGPWRAFADFVVAGPAGARTAATLGVDLTVAGPYQPRPLPPAGRESTVDLYTVTYEGTPAVGRTQALLFRVFANGRPVTDLQPYLGAYGHLVVLRDGDLGYVHVHPENQLYGGAVKFWLAAPSPGRYRMFFDFRTGERVHTAQYTLVVTR
jgi:hypothetical protein